MDRRGWPWKKKSSEKATNVLETVAAPTYTSVGIQEDQDNVKDAVKYVQLAEERYAHLSGLEDQVKVLNEKLSTSQSEITAKENLVKQHTRVAEEAVSGWEKAEAEALALKNQLESITLLKLSAEERAVHLDGALKECMKQVRSVKEEGEQKLHDIVFAKTKQWEQIKFDLEAKIDAFEQELLRASAENDALSRSLQERSNMLMMISDEKSCCDSEIEVLKLNIQSYEREISSLKYEVHVVTKELEIRNEEKNMSVRSADVANKQHLEDVKKISKLEAECQRLRALVRKKLPGPAALAQMKQEVERDYGESRLRRSPAKSSSLHMGMGFSPDFAIENIQQYQKENEFLTARIMATEEETKMLKEALSKRNSELQASRNMFAKTASKLRSLEAQVVLKHNRSPSKFIFDTCIETSPNHANSKPPSMTSMSEDGIDDEGVSNESWATALMSELSQFKKDGDKSSKAGSSNHLELMDDFLEMEKLAFLSTESNGPVTVSDGGIENQRTEISDDTPPDDICDDVKSLKGQSCNAGLPDDTSSFNEQGTSKDIVHPRSAEQLSRLQEQIFSLFESQDKSANIERVLEDIKWIIQDLEDGISRIPESLDATGARNVNTSDDGKLPPVNSAGTACLEDTIMQQGVATIEMKPAITENLKIALIQIHDFVLSFGSNFDAQNVEKFCSVFNRVLSCDTDIDNFILVLSCILTGVKGFGCDFDNDKNNDGVSNNTDCIDKVTLLENKVVQREFLKETQMPSDQEIVEDGEQPVFELDNLNKVSIEEFQQLKQEKEDLATDLSKCSEILDQTKNQLLQTEQQVEALQSQLDLCQKSNSLIETQLKCMAESYRSLESRSQELETEISNLRIRAEMLHNELEEERSSHQEDLAKLNNLQEDLARSKDLQEQAERDRRRCLCFQSPENDGEVKTKQEQEIAAAAEKLAECQETILLLGKQLQAMRPQKDIMGPPKERHASVNDCSEDVCGTDSLYPRPRQSGIQLECAEMETVPVITKAGGESPFDVYGSYNGQSETEVSPIPMSPFNPKSGKNKSSRSSLSPADEKHVRGSFGRFFSKGKNNH